MFSSVLKTKLYIVQEVDCQYITSKTGRKMIYWEGYCPVHIKILAEDILREKQKYPHAEVMVHPECTPEVIKLADVVRSTSGMCKYAKESKTREIIVATEIGIIYRLQKENPDKKFYPASELAICPNMKLTNLEKVLWTLEDLKNEVKVPHNIRVKAREAVDKMLTLSSKD
jgi:quinolinate synthase